jgi:hypothetical protein
MDNLLSKQELDFISSFLCCSFETGGSADYVFNLECDEAHKFDAEGKRICKTEIFDHHPSATLRVYGLDGETMEDTKWHELTADKMLKAIKKHLDKVSKYKHIEDDDAGYYDNGDADIAMQYALFGEVVYG